MGELRPDLRDIALGSEFFSDYRVQSLMADEFAALVRLVWQSAVARVWTYSPPDHEGGIPADQGTLARICKISRRRLNKIWPSISSFFSEQDGKLYLTDEWVRVAIGTQRPPIAPSLRLKVLERDGFRCGYCGSSEGPFDCDHIIPVSQGGATDDSNLLCACAKCNRSKGPRRPEEWIV